MTNCQEMSEKFAKYLNIFKHKQLFWNSIHTYSIGTVHTKKFWNRYRYYMYICMYLSKYAHIYAQLPKLWKNVTKRHTF